MSRSNKVINEMVLKLYSFDHRALDKAVRDIIAIVRKNGDRVKGPIPLPTKIEQFAVIRSTHVHKESGEHFKRKSHCRRLSIEPSPQTIDDLRRLDLPASVAVHLGTMA